MERRGLGINVAGLVPLTPLRHYVLGEASLERPATSEEMATMCALLGEALCAGAFGLNTTTSQNHTGYGATPLACRHASQEELVGLCQTLHDVGLGTIEIVLNSAGMHAIDEADVALLRLLTRESGRSVTWLALFARPGGPDFHHTPTVPRLGDLLAQAMPQVSPRPIFMQGDLRNPTMYSTYRAWQPTFGRTMAEQIALYQQPAFRDAFVEDVALRKRHHLWGQTRVLEIMHSALVSYEGKTIGEIAALEGKRPVDADLDLAIADDLQTRFQTALFNYDEPGVERLIRDERFLIGLSDGGAHVDVLCDAGYATALLDIWVRQREVLSLEQAIHKLTAVLAALFGIPDRGTLAEADRADLVLFDPQTVAAKPPEYMRHFPAPGPALDLEGGGDRRHVCGGDPGVRGGHVYRVVSGTRVAQSRIATARRRSGVGEQPGSSGKMWLAPATSISIRRKWCMCRSWMD
jgi:N-acyl-D-amino-acid deacylase